MAGIRKRVEGDGAVERIEDPLTMHLGPRDILVNLKVRFRGGLSTQEVGAAVDRLEEALRSGYPDIKPIFIEPAPLMSCRESSTGAW